MTYAASFRERAPASSRARAFGLAFALVLHALLLCLLWVARSPEAAAPTDALPLTLWDVARPPPPAKPPPPEPRRPPPATPTEKPPGGSERKLSPIRAPVPEPALALPRATIAPVPVLKPVQPAALPGPSGAAGTGTTGDSDAGKGSGEGEGVGAGRGGVSITAARWYRKPGPRDLDPHVPWKLRQQPIKAVVYLNCRVSLNKRVHNCKVVKEVPTGSGFGAAALAATRSFRVWPATVDGKPVDDAGVIVPVEYNYE